MIALILTLLIQAISLGVSTSAMVVIPNVVFVSEEQEWAEYYSEAYNEYADEFTALFNSYETKVAKNGALMIRKGNSGSYTFAKKG